MVCVVAFCCLRVLTTRLHFTRWTTYRKKKSFHLISHLFHIVNLFFSSLFVCFGALFIFSSCSYFRFVSIVTYFLKNWLQREKSYLNWKLYLNNRFAFTYRTLTIIKVEKERRTQGGRKKKFLCLTTQNRIPNH